MTENEKKTIIEEFLDSAEYTKSTRGYYTDILKSFDRYLVSNKKTLEAYSRDDVIAYYKTKPWESSSTHTFIAIAKSFAQWRVRKLNRQLVGAEKKTFDDLMIMINDFNDVVDMKRPKLIQKMRRDTIMTMDMLQEMFKTMIDKDKTHMDFRFSWCIWWFGCRVGEFLALDMTRSVNFDTREVVFITEKTNKERLGWFDDYTGKIILHFRKNPAQFNVTRKTIWQNISSYGKGLGIELYPKRGRQTFQTYMDGIASDDKELKEKYKVKLDDTITKILVGHTIKGNMTAVYKQCPPEMLKEFVLKYHYMIPLESEFPFIWSE